MVFSPVPFLHTPPRWRFAGGEDFYRGILHGDVLTDMCIAVLFYPLALVQHEKELRAPDDFYDVSEKESEEKEA